MGDTCKSMADSSQCMTKPTSIKKKKKRKKQKKNHFKKRKSKKKKKGQRTKQTFLQRRHTVG